MYFPYFMTYMVVGAAITIPVFIWALRNDQFKHQERARFLPLEGEEEPAALRRAASPRISRFRRCEPYALLTLVCLGLAASFSVVIFALTH